VIRSIWVFGVSRLGVDTVLASKEQAAESDAMQFVVFPTPLLSRQRTGDVYDMAILFEHYLQGNDVFVTLDSKRVLRPHVVANLRRRWGVRVMRPSEAIRLLNTEYGLHQVSD
jgi:hypothetical protein